MARPKNQQARRGDLMAATRRLIVRDGLAAVRVRNIASEAGLSSGLVNYYFPEIDELFHAVYSDAVDRFATHRRKTVEAIPDPRDRLVTMIRSGLPSGPDDDLCILLYEFGPLVRRSPVVHMLRRTLFDRQVAVYQSILDVGHGLGIFTLAEPSTAVAHNLVALEDAFGHHVVGQISVAAEEAEAYLLSYASVATSCTLRAGAS